jgi:hypothetical protein
MNHKRTSPGQRAAALLATLSAGTLLVIACSSSAPPPVQAGPGDNDSSTGGDVAVGQDANGSGSDSSSSGGNDGTSSTPDSSVPADDGPSKGPVDSSTYADLTQGFDVASLPDANSLDSTVPCGILTCSGCCDTTGTCQQTTSDTVCGGEGNPCVDCTQTSQVCSSGTCH